MQSVIALSGTEPEPAGSRDRSAGILERRYRAGCSRHAPSSRPLLGAVQSGRRWESEVSVMVGQVAGVRMTMCAATSGGSATSAGSVLGRRRASLESSSARQPTALVLGCRSQVLRWPEAAHFSSGSESSRTEEHSEQPAMPRARTVARSTRGSMASTVWRSGSLGLAASSRKDRSR